MDLTCPYCGEPVELEIDPGGPEVEDYQQDCAVCCRPWEVHVERGEDGEARVTLSREDD